jgi:hypothetical protein
VTIAGSLDSLDRGTLVAVAHEYMLTGMLVTRAMLPQVVLAGGGLDAMNEVAIDEWMGASPVYTGRMRRLMGIEGDDVAAIMKALQLDVGFVHQYMDVGYRVIDPHHGEFWLEHCGALLDAEPHGEERVFGMCHTIEDPTFDATAVATNPRARIRPIHRPPRVPPDRHPHCHWTITIDAANEPVQAAPLTGRVAALPLAGVPNAVRGDRSDGMADYRGPVRPTLRLSDLANGTLAAVAREFQVQSHLLVCSGHLAVRDRFGDDVAHRIAVATCLGAAWVESERLAAALGAGGDAAGLARVLALHPMVPPGCETAAEVDGDRVRVVVTPTVPGLLDAGHPGCPGLLAAGEVRVAEAMVHALVPTAAVTLDTGGGRLAIEVDTAAGRPPVREPDEVALAKIGMAASWSFDLARG